VRKLRGTGEVASWLELFTRYYPVDHIKEDGMGETCGTYGTENNRYWKEMEHFGGL
jgi:hypothetical protein